MSTAKRETSESGAKQATGSAPGASGAASTDKGATPAGSAADSASRPNRDKAPAAGAPSSPAPSHGLPVRRIAIIVVLALAALGGYALYRVSRAREDEAHLVLQGNIDVRQVNLAFKVEGRITSLEVDEGDKVETEQLLAALDKKYFEDDLRVVRARRDNAVANLSRLEHGSRPEEIASAKAQSAEQRASLKRAEQDFDRAERLVGQGAVSRETFDQAKAALDEAKARLKAAEEAERMAVIGPRHEDIDAARAELAAEEAAVIQSERRLTDSELFAPSNGIILTRAREKGAIVAPGETVFTLTLASPVWVRTYVNERDLGRIHPGMPATVTTDSAPDKAYHGQIGFISPTAEFTPKTVETRELRTNLVYRLRVIVDNPDNGLRQGMPVTVALDLDARK